MLKERFEEVPPNPPTPPLDSVKSIEEIKPPPRLGEDFLAELEALSLPEEVAKARSFSSPGTIVIVGDLHGFSEAIPEIRGLAKKESDTVVVFTGDSIDRGAKSREILQEIFSLQKANPKNFIALYGNHELLHSYPVNFFVELVATSLITEYPDKITESSKLLFIKYLDAILVDINFRLGARYNDLNKCYKDIASLKQVLTIRQEGKISHVGPIAGLSLESINEDFLQIIFDNLSRIGDLYVDLDNLLKRNLSLFVKGENCLISHTIPSKKELGSGDPIHSLLFARPKGISDTIFIKDCQYFFRGHDIACATNLPIVITKDNKVIFTVHSFTQLFLFNPQDVSIPGVYIMFPMSIVCDEKGVRLHILEDTFEAQLPEQIKIIPSLNTVLGSHKLKIIFSEKIKKEIQDFNNTESYLDQRKKFIDLKRKVEFITLNLMMALKCHLELALEKKVGNELKNTIEIVFGSEELLKFYEYSLGMSLSTHYSDAPTLSFKSFKVVSNTASPEFCSYAEEIKRQLIGDKEVTLVSSVKVEAENLLAGKNQDALQKMVADFNEAVSVEVVDVAVMTDVNGADAIPLLKEEYREKSEKELARSRSRCPCFCDGIIQLFNLFSSVVCPQKEDDKTEKVSPGPSFT